MVYIIDTSQGSPHKIIGKVSPERDVFLAYILLIK